MRKARRETSNMAKSFAPRPHDPRDRGIADRRSMEAFGEQFSQTRVVPRLGAVNQGLEAFMCDSLRSTRDERPGVVSPRCRFDIAILIVGFRNSEDILSCLAALSRMECEAAFDVFICEN